MLEVGCNCDGVLPPLRASLVADTPVVIECCAVRTPSRMECSFLSRAVACRWATDAARERDAKHLLPPLSAMCRAESSLPAGAGFSLCTRTERRSSTRCAARGFKSGANM